MYHLRINKKLIIFITLVLVVPFFVLAVNDVQITDNTNFEINTFDTVVATIITASSGGQATNFNVQLNYIDVTLDNLSSVTFTTTIGGQYLKIIKQSGSDDYTVSPNCPTTSAILTGTGATVVLRLEVLTTDTCPVAPSVNGGGGGGGGGGGDTPIYVPPEPELTISNLLSPNIATDSLTLTWITNFSASSYVIYSTEGESHELNMSDDAGSPPTYGYMHATSELDVDPKVTLHSYTITGLTPDTTYYFRTVSRGSLAISQEYQTTTQAVAEIQTEYQSGASEQTTGEEETNVEVAEQSETVPVIEEVSETEVASQPTNTEQQTAGLTASIGAASLMSSVGGFITNPYFITILAIILILLAVLWIIEKKVDIFKIKSKVIRRK